MEVSQNNPSEFNQKSVLAVSGKGGTGKTVISAIIIKHLNKKNIKILAIDADPATTLPPALGVTIKNTIGDIREKLVSGPGRGPTPDMPVDLMLEYQIRDILAEKPKISVLAVGRPEGPGCYCLVNDILRHAIEKFAGRYDITIIDCEAGLEHLSRRTTRSVDTMIIVTDATSRGIHTAKLIKEIAESLEIKSRDIIASTMQRIVSKYTTEITTTAVDLPNDEMKGRIIGREGRNIKVIEKLTGTEIIVDDTPNSILISGFSPIRRHIAKKTLDRLILDGRIHPTKIEEAIEESKRDLALDIKKAGEDALYDVGITGFDPKLIQILGRLKYRTSYGQNALNHSLEVAHLSALIAGELGQNVTIAKKAGILHDIGKAVDHEVKGTHPEIGRDIAKKFNLPQEIIDPIETHHDDHPRGLMSIIVKVADAISGARPGARNDTYERYLQRLEELEKIAELFEGVEKTYAIQAGRELRVIVGSENEP